MKPNILHKALLLGLYLATACTARVDDAQDDAGLECLDDPECAREFSACIEREREETITCANGCAEMGLVCVPNGCDGSTYQRFTGCEDDDHDDGGLFDGLCDESVDWQMFTTGIQCCCTEVHE